MRKLLGYLIVLCSLSFSVFTGSAQARDASADPEETYRFNIPAGALGDAVTAFQALTGLRVAVPPAPVIRDLASPGVAGLYTAEQALEKLLTGTGLGFRLVAPHAYALDVHVAPQSVEVTGRFVPYRATESATATRTGTPLRDIPQTLTVLPRQLLQDQNAQSMADALKNVPGVTVAQGEGNRDQIVLRGINTTSDFFVNGIRDDQERFRDLYNVESVEVLQGPAAVLFGRGGAGGVVNLVTTKAVRGLPSEIAVDTGSYDRKRTTAQVGLPLGPNGAFRLIGMAEKSGGFRDAYFLHRYGVNPTAAFGLGDATTLTVGFEHLYDRRRADRGIPSQAGRPVDVRPGQFFGSVNQNEATSGVDSVSATLEHRFGGGLRLRNSVLVGRYDKFYQNVYAGSAVSAAGTFSLAAYNQITDRTNAFNQTDLIYGARFGGMEHVLLAGVEVGHQFQDELRRSPATISNVQLASSTRDANFGAVTVVTNRHASSDIVAGYVQDQVSLTSRWKAVFGARIDYFKVTVEDHLPGNPDLSRADTAASPRVGLIYQPDDAVSLYGSYSYTFLPSGQTLGLALNTAQLAPENARNYEVGAKLDVIRNRLSLSAAAFRLDRNNARNTDPNDFTRLVLTGQQRTDGLVVSAAGSLTPRWQIHGGYATLDARITRDTVGAPAGRGVGLVPRSQLTLWSTYDISRQWGAGGGVLQQTTMFASFSNQVELPGFARVDGVVYYRIRGYRIALNAENLFNTKYFPTAHSDNNISPGSPRNVQISLRAAF